MKYKVFIDGAEGTTGLKIHQYFQKRDDIELLKIDSDKRKDLEERLALVKKADVSFLCLPDAAAKELAAAAPADCRIKDGVNMGLPMLSEYEIWRTDVDNIRAAKKVLEEL